jgi:hypothetical protein
VQGDLPAAFVQAAGARAKPPRFTAALLGHAAGRGRLRLRRWAVAASAFGDLDFDLRDATIEQQQATVTVLAAFGNVDIYVPEGVTVDVGGLTVFGHRRDWGHDAGRPDAPAIRVCALGFAGTIDVWRVPHDMRGSSYRDIFRALEHGLRQLPAGRAARRTDREAPGVSAAPGGARAGIITLALLLVSEPAAVRHRCANRIRGRVDIAGQAGHRAVRPEEPRAGCPAHLPAHR